MRIAVWCEQKRSIASHLPPDWTAILSITRLGDDALEDLIKDGTINARASRREIERGIKQTKRLAHHPQIAEGSKFAATAQLKEGRFALIYADPPWSSEAHSESGTDRTPSTMTVKEIMGLEVHDLPVRHLAAKDAVCLLWCTPSTLKRAIGTLEAWGFSYRTNFVWDMQKTGTGFICLNQHELLLYGTRGNAPTPLKIYPSILRSLRGKHSEKPTAVREMLEKMFPHFNEHSRIELFCRGEIPSGWSAWGLEALNLASVNVANSAEARRFDLPPDGSIPDFLKRERPSATLPTGTADRKEALAKNPEAKPYWRAA
jgi:N6-adenosine-specific RNA methylase IME4